MFCPVLAFIFKTTVMGYCESRLLESILPLLSNVMVMDTFSNAVIVLMRLGILYLEELRIKSSYDNFYETFV